ncbi:Hypothetical_protein [Hexamita inflata]|uniref:Hypothetical_protein n=1 Tax=Hexamita inflata TaxID=28002 RepID=A0AA86PE25_9EUKA|nr:Hypothetical protein HINF_LOCUS25115 [Hexamita inflata]
MKTNATIEYLAIILIPKQQNIMIFHGVLTKHKHRFYAVNILQRFRVQEQMSMNRKKLIKELIKSQQKSLFPALNLEALRVAADTLVPRFIPAIQKIVTKITSEVNNVSSSAELTQVA